MFTFTASHIRVKKYAETNVLLFKIVELCSMCAENNLGIFQAFSFKVLQLYNVIPKPFHYFIYRN